MNRINEMNTIKQTPQNKNSSTHNYQSCPSASRRPVRECTDYSINVDRPHAVQCTDVPQRDIQTDRQCTSFDDNNNNSNYYVQLLQHFIGRNVLNRNSHAHTRCHDCPTHSIHVQYHIGRPTVHRTTTTKLAERAFSVAGPSVWNSLPVDLQLDGCCF